MYNDEMADKVEAVTKANSYIFTPSNGGTAAMLVREYAGYELDDHLSIFKAPYGVVKVQ